MELKEILKITKGKIISGELKNKEVGKICINSKLLEQNDIFITLKGNKTDGSKYIKDVIEKASLIITNKRIKLKSKTPIIKVKNTSKALKQIGKYNRIKYIDKPLIAITGSVGKTTTKELISHIFKTKYNILKTYKNYNNQIGVPLMLSRINENHDIIILELGMNHLKEIEKLSKICRPQTSIITNIGTSHIGYLKTQENILKAKLEIVKGMKKGNLIINGNDFYLNKIKKNKKYSIIKTNENCISNISIDDKLHFKINIKNKEYNIDFDIPNRLNIIKLKNNIKLIDDTYNASLESIKSSLSILENKENKLVILGDVLELGKHSKEIHKKIEEELNKIKNINLLKTGKYTKEIKKGKHFKDNKEIIKYLNKKNLKNLTILIKGSRGMHLEEIKDFLLKKYST